jgi:hypothetical protein
LIDALWRASPPVSAVKLLRVYVSQLRRLLPAPARIRTRGSGYTLEFEELALDAARFELLLREGQAVLRDGNAALALFLERARAAEPSFGTDEADERAAALICERLDRLPLAIELAASRVRMLTPTELLERLEPRLPLLSGGPRDLPARQQTMRATLAWSHDLLDEPEQRDFRRLVIFADGCTLQAAEAVCESTLERLSALAEHSLLQRATTASGSRFQMLETVREYAAGHLKDSGELEQTSRRHLEFFLALAEGCNLYAEAEGPQDFETVNAEQDNLRAAIAWALQAGLTEPALRLAVALENFWVTHDPAEGIRIIAPLLDTGIEIPDRLRARALRALGGSTHIACEHESAKLLYVQSRALFQALADKQQTAIVDYRLALIALELGDLERARVGLKAPFAPAARAGERHRRSGPSASSPAAKERLSSRRACSSKAPRCALRSGAGGGRQACSRTSQSSRWNKGSSTRRRPSASRFSNWRTDRGPREHPQRVGLRCLRRRS